MNETPAEKAIRLLGGATEAARKLSVKQARVSMWQVRKQIPGQFCLAVEQALGGELTANYLRPDIFGPSPAKPKRAVA